MDPHYGDRVEAEGLVVRIHGTRRLALAPPEHLTWRPGLPAPVHQGTEPWLISLQKTPLLSEGELLRCRGEWVGDSIQVAEAQEISRARPAMPVTDELGFMEEEFDPQQLLPFNPPEWTVLERELFKRGVITGRAYLRGDVLRYSGDDPEEMASLLVGIHPRMEFVSCIATKAERKLASSIDHLATEAGVLCAVGSGTNLNDPSQPLYTFDVARLTNRICKALENLPVGLVRVNSHLIALREGSDRSPCQ